VKFILASLFFLICSQLQAQTIKAVDVRGNERLSKAAILQYVSSKPGDELSRVQVRDDLKALYHTGLFSDLRIDVEQMKGGVRLVVVVKEKDYIQKIVFEGNLKISTDDLKKALDLKVPFLWDEALVKDSIEKLRKLYRDKGYYLVTMRSEIVKEGRQKELKFKIDEGSKVEIRKIYIQGNKNLSDETLKDAMITKEGGFWSSISRRGQFDENLLVQIDSRRIQMKYLKRGYAFARVDTPSITFTPDRRSVIVSYNVSEGDQYRVGHISFSGDTDFIHTDQLLSELKSQKGQLWNYLNIRDDIQKAQDIYGNRGYAYANVSPSWTVSDSTNKILDIDFRIDKGSIVHFGSIDIQGNFDTLDQVIRRELEFSEGELYNVTKYRESKSSLEKLGYFSSVKFIQKDVLAQKKIDIVIDVKEKQTGSLSLGASFSSFDRFGLQGSVSKVNLFGRGYDVSLSAMFSSRRQIFNAYFRNPRVNDSLYSLTLQAFNTEIQSIDETQIKERGGSISVGHPIAKN